MNSIKIRLLLLASLLVIMSPSYGQFGGLADRLRSVGGSSDDKAETTGLADVLTSSILGGGSRSSEGGNLVTNFVASYGFVLDAQTAFSRAFGMEEQAMQLEAEKLALSSGQVDKDALVKARDLSESVQSEINDRTAQGIQLDEQGKEQYSQGLVSYFLGLAQAKRLVDSVESMDFSADSLLRSLGDAANSLYVATETPGYLSNLLETGGMLLNFAGDNGIEVPDDATSLLDSL